MSTSSDESVEGFLGGSIRPGTKPNELVLDPESSLEGNLTGCGCFQLFALVFLGFVGLDSGDNWMFYPMAFLLLGTLIAFGLRMALDDHYVIDTNTKELFFHRNFLGSSNRKRICALNDLFGLLVKPARKTSKESVWWEYGLVLVRPNGEQIEVITPSDRDFDNIALHGQMLATQLDLHFDKGEPEHLLQITNQGTQPEISWQPYSSPTVASSTSGKKPHSCTIAIILIFFGLLLVATITILAAS